MNPETGKKAGAFAATAMLHLYLVAMALFFAVVVVATPASASCVVHISDESCQGNCAVNIGDCSGGTCLLNIGASCFSGGNCPANVVSWCAGSCTVNAALATCYNNCAVNVASTC